MEDVTRIANRSAFENIDRYPAESRRQTVAIGTGADATV